jgi:GNAT superfamily N-acetyltransferase
MGRVIGDGGLQYYLTGIVVAPLWQRRGIGTRIIMGLNGYLDKIRFRNTWVGVFPTEGMCEFYTKMGYKAQAGTAPAMYRWINRSEK